jgi:hypothetical protein
MDREELDQKIRQRRPGQGSLRRGSPPDEDAFGGRATGYVAFAPEPEDAMALHEPDPDEPAANIDNTSTDFDRPVQAMPPMPPMDESPQPYEPPQPYQPPAPPEQVAPAPHYEPRYDEPPNYEPQPYAAAEDPAPYGAPEDAYPYSEPAYAAAAGDGRRRGGSSALPIIGFIVLCVLALGVGAVLASVLGGNGGVAQATATPSVTESAGPSVEPSNEPSGSTPGQQATPEPTDGPITFADGAIIRVQPCATQAMSFDGCKEDGSTITDPTMWVWIGFEHASGSDNFTLTLQSDGQTVDQQEKELGTVLDCPGSCSGYLIGAAYRDLAAGDYQLIVRRNGDFADSASFTVEG